MNKLLRNVSGWVIFLIMFPGLSSCQDESENQTSINSVQEIIDDMAKCHEARPQGIAETVNWSKCPRLGMGNHPGEFTAMIPWGQVYVPVEGNPATNARVQLRNLETYYLSKTDNKWHLWNGSFAVEGAAYVEDFAGDVSKPADVRTEPDGSVSIRTEEGFNYHFWTTQGRSKINPGHVKGVFSTCQARLIRHDENLPDDRDSARYILSIGADYWLNLEAEWDQWKTNGDIGIGRFKLVTKSWQAFNMHSLSEDELRKNPPPMR